MSRGAPKVHDACREIPIAQVIRAEAPVSGLVVQWPDYNSQGAESFGYDGNTSGTLRRRSSTDYNSFSRVSDSPDYRRGNVGTSKR